MGIKSTQYLTYEQAIRLYVSFRQEAMQRKLTHEAHGFTVKELEDELEHLNDIRFDGEGFDNYSITDGPGF